MNYLSIRKDSNKYFVANRGKYFKLLRKLDRKNVVVFGCLHTENPTKAHLKRAKNAMFIVQNTIEELCTFPYQP